MASRKGEERTPADFAATIYQAAIDPCPETAWVHALSNYFGRAQANILVMRAEDRNVLSSTSTGRLENRDREFVEQYQYRDHLVRPREALIPFNRVRRMSDIVSPQVLQSSEFYKEYFRWLGIHDFLVLAVQSGSLRMHVHINQSTGEDPLGRRDVEGLAGLTHHIQTALRMRDVVRLSRATAAWAFTPFEKARFAFALLSGSGSVEYANPLFVELLDEAERICLAEGKLTSPVPSQASKLQRLIKGAGEDGAGGSAILGAGCGKQPLTASVFPFPALDAEANAGRYIGIFVVDPARPPIWSMETLRDGFGLTVSQARVAMLLVNGHSTEDIADMLTLQAGSVRAHLKSIFAKTQTHSQLELVHTLLASAPIC